VIAQRHRPAAAEARVPLEHLELLELVANGVGNGRVVVGGSGLAAEMANCYRNTNSIIKYITNYFTPPIKNIFFRLFSVNHIKIV
jgi:hypothetical protein